MSIKITLHLGPKEVADLAPVSEALRQKQALEMKLQQLNELDPETPSSTVLATSYLDQKDVNTIHRRRTSTHSKTTPQIQRQESDLAKVAAAVEAEMPLDDYQIRCFRRIIRTEIEGLNEEIQGKCSPESKNVYPKNLNIRDFAGYIPLPTVVYELEYPRQDHINWSYVAEKTAATFGVLVVMNVVSQSYIYPAVIMCLDMKEQGMPFQQRLQEMPWILSDLLFPIMMEYLLSWYVIWECIVSSPIHSSAFISIIAVKARPFFPLTLSKAQRAGGTHPLRRPRVLRRLVEQHVVGPVFARLEPARACLFAAARLPLVHQRAAHFPHLGHAHHVPAQRVRA